MKGEKDRFIILGDISTPFSIINRTTRQKINKKRENLNNTVKQLYMKDIYRTYYLRAAACILFSRAHGMERTKRPMKLMITLFFLDQPKLSIKDAIMFSKTAITVLREAKDINTKNSVPQTLPPFMFTNTLGRVTKIRDGPESGETLKEKQEGKIIRPDTTATNVSRSEILNDSERRVFSFDIYVPKISIEPIPRERVKNAWFMAATITERIPLFLTASSDGTR